MKIVIISDSHDNIPNLEKFLNWAKNNQIETIIHCGDLCAPGTLKNVLAPQFSGKIYLIHGNVSDRELLPEVAKSFSNVKFFNDFGEIEIDSKKIAFTHYPEEAKKIAESGKYNLIFYGHDHKPWIQKSQTNAEETQTNAENRQCKSALAPLDAKLSNGVDPRRSALLVNPGTLAGMFNKATFAVYDTETDKLELKILELL